MSEFNVKKISDGINFLSVQKEGFKTNEITIAFAVPLKKDSVSKNAAVPYAISESCEKFSTRRELDGQLEMLYGASLDVNIRGKGTYQIIRISISSLNNKFALDGENISSRATDLLLNIIFKPKTEKDGFLSAENIKSAKRQLIEKIQSLESDKRYYALTRAKEIMFENLPYGIKPYGYVDRVNSLEQNDVTQAYHNILSEAEILITAVGEFDFDDTYNKLKKEFSTVSRAYKKSEIEKPDLDTKQVKDSSERIDIKQGKLVLGLNAECDQNNPDDVRAMKTFSDVLGGGPYSKCFMNVREKMSLCYYCSARFYTPYSAIFIQSGCEEENMDKAIKEIGNQLNDIISGDFDAELAASKKSICDFLSSVGDDPALIDEWYSAQITDGVFHSPDEIIKIENDVDKEQIIECAKKIKLNTVFRLLTNRKDKK